MKRVLVAVTAVLSASIVLSPAFAANTTPPTATPAPSSKKTSPLGQINLATLTKTIEFGDLKTYEHASGYFTIDVPENWAVNDASTDSEAITYFLDPSKNALILARVVVAPNEPDMDALGEMLQGYVETTFGKQKSYEAEDPKQMSSGDMMGMGFSFDAAQNGKTFRMFGDGFGFKDGLLASTLIFISPKDQYEKIKKQAYEVMASYKANPDALENKQAEDIIGDLTLYKHSKGAFQIKVPETWEVKDQTKAGQAVVGFVEPNGKAELVVEVYKSSRTFDADALKDLVTEYANDSYGKRENLVVNEAANDGEASAKVTATFDMPVGDETVQMVSILYVDKVPGAVAFLRMAVPVDNVSVLIDKLNEIGESYKITKNPKI